MEGSSKMITNEEEAYKIVLKWYQEVNDSKEEESLCWYEFEAWADVDDDKPAEINKAGVSVRLVDSVGGVEGGGGACRADF